VITGLVVVVVADAVGAVFMYVFEKGEHDGAINAFTDALFFSTVQLLTISSQMPNPVTGGGRLTDVALEVFGLFVVTALAGSFASFFLHVAAERMDAAE
jgi:drug/metabolite transporter (DMT)-like permease